MSGTTQRPTSGSALAAFRDGFLAPWDGLRYLLLHRELWRYGVMPIALNVAITLLVLAMLVLTVAGFAVYLHPKFPEGTLGIVWEVVAVVAMLLLAVGLAAATWMLLNGVLTGYYYGKLAEAVERQLGVAPGEIREIPLRHQVVDAVCDFGALVVVNTGLLLLNCLPLLGTVAAACGALYFNAYVFGRDFLDYPLALRGIRRKEKLVFCRRHRWHAIGVGSVVLVLGLVPLFGALVLTTAAAGSVLLHRRLTRT